MAMDILRRAKLCALGLMVCAGAALGGEPTAVWSGLDRIPAEEVAAEPWVRPMRYHAFMFDMAAARAVLANAPQEFTPEATAAPVKLPIPLPDGTLAEFNFIESSVMHPDLQARFPEVRTYIGTLDGDPGIWGRFSVTPAGFNGMIFTPEGTLFIDPYTKGNSELHTAYWKRDYPRTEQWQCYFDPARDGGDVAHGIGKVDRPGAGAPELNGTQLKTYRIGIACTGEYAAFHGGTVAGAQAAIVVTLNRVNAVYEKDLAIRMTLIPQNTNVVFTNASTDPYTNSDGIAMLSQNQSTFNNVTFVGSANYDIGHVVSTGGGGVAGLGVVCSNTNKARGVTGSPSPVGDPFDIDYVAHEIGHQWAGNHSFNGTLGSCTGGNRNGATAFEPGSGSTIMAYAGICGSDDLQPNSDAYMHSISLNEIVTFITTGAGNNCDVATATGNTIPTVNAGPDYTIPTGVQFLLTATGSDANGDSLTYCWEQRDLGAANSPTVADPGSGPIFRSTNPTSSPSLALPRVTNFSTNARIKGDRYPNTNRTMNFRVFVRDNRAGGGAIAFDDMQVTSALTTGTFSVSNVTGSPFNAGANMTVAWNVAGTTGAPWNTANVRIELSTDNGVTWPYVLASSTANDGSEVVVVPAVPATSSICRVRVLAVGNIWYDVGGNNFTVNAPTAPAAPTGVTAGPNPVCAGGSTTLSGTVPGGVTIDWFTGSCGGTLVGTGTSLPVSPASTTTYFARARNTTSGLVSVSCGSVTVTVNPLPTAPSSASVDRNDFCAGDTGSITLSAVGGSGATLEWFTGSCGGTPVGTGTNLVIASPSADTTYFARWTNSCGSTACVSVAVNVNEADVTGDLGVPDGVIDLADFFEFLNWFDTNDIRADITGDLGVPDGVVDLADFFFFLNLFDVGC